MTVEEAARRQLEDETHDLLVLPWRDLYVRAFRQGAEWMQTQETQEVRRAWTADKDTTPPAGSTAATDQG